MDLDTARAGFEQASRAAEDVLLDVIAAQERDRPGEEREALERYVVMQQACLDAHARFTAAAARHHIAEHMRERMAQTRARLERELASARDPLARPPVAK